MIAPPPTRADLVAVRRRAWLARERADRYAGTSEQMRRKLEARAAMTETVARLIAYALAETGAERRGHATSETACGTR